MDKKKEIDKYFNTRMKDLKEYYLRFSSGDDLNNFPEMLSELYIQSIKNIDKFDNKMFENGEFHYYAIKFIYNQKNWNKTNFKKMTEGVVNNSDYLDNNEDKIEDIMENEELLSQKQYEFDNRMAKLNESIYNLDLHEKILFDKYYKDRKPMRKIGKEVGLSATAICKMVNEIKVKLKSEQ